MWRQSKKLGSLLGDVEDISRRKQLAAIALQAMNKIWIQNYKTISLQIRIQLFEALVLSILLYNCSCWGLRKCDSENLNSFHRRLLRQICKFHWPHTISSHKLYKLTGTQPLTIRIASARWKYFGHALRMNANAPPRMAMNYFFQPETTLKKFGGSKRATIVTTLQSDIQATKHKFPHFQIKNLISINDLETIRIIALDRKSWRRITKAVTDTVQANCLALQGN